MTRLFRILRAALLAAESNALVQMLVIVVIIALVFAQWR